MLERLIDHAALFPPASMSLPEALEEDRRARESPYGWLVDRFVVPAGKLADLPAERPALSVVLSSLDDVALLDGAADVEAVELVLPSARPRVRRARGRLQRAASRSTWRPTSSSCSTRAGATAFPPRSARWPRSADG